MNYYYLLFIPLGLAAFVGFWCLVVKLISLMAWQQLATSFRVAALPPGPQWPLGHARLGIVSYKNALNMVVTPQGLGLAPGALFRIGHPPVLVPWSAVGPFQAKKSLWLTYYTTPIRTPAGGSIALSFSNPHLLEAARPWITVPDNLA